MKQKHAILEYRRARRTRGKKAKPAKWGFRFKAPDGKTLIESVASFASQRQAEQGFLSMIKSIAANQYTIRTPVAAKTQDVANN
jgi:uncharacterized protein YegP (UPF0339 family)